MTLALPPAFSPRTLWPRSALAFPQPPPLRRLRELFEACVARLHDPPRLELRIDVQHPPQSIETELDALHRCLHDPDDALSRCASLLSPFLGLVLRHREADGEHYLYVEDVANGRRAGAASARFASGFPAGRTFTRGSAAAH